METIVFNKTECGVDFLLNVLPGAEVATHYRQRDVYQSDCFEILFFRKAEGYLLVDQTRLPVRDQTIVFLSPYQRRQWKTTSADFTVLLFREDFLNEFFADKLFSYRLLYFYQHDHPLTLSVSAEELDRFCQALTEIKAELTHSRGDSGHLIRSLLYYLLLRLNRNYALQYGLSLDKPENHYAFEFKKLMETHIREKQRVNEYASLLQVSRISLNKAVQQQFFVTAAHLLKQRMVVEIKNLLLHDRLSVGEAAATLHFSETNHLMRFFKTQTGQTISEFLRDYQNGSSSE